MNEKDTVFETTAAVHLGEDAHIRANRLPIMTGFHEGDLNCGSCGLAIATGVSLPEIHERFQTEQRLIIECICGALNIIPKA